MDFILFFTDDSLTVDNVTKVLEMVTDDMIKNVWDWLGVPDSLVEMITRNLSTKKQKTRACVVLYLNYCPENSWQKMANTLYILGEMAAAGEARTFFYEKGR